MYNVAAIAVMSGIPIPYLSCASNIVHYSDVPMNMVLVVTVDPNEPQ
jgi:hypothetical protein